MGGEAIIYYGHARLTGDVDFFYEATPENAERLYAALREFWGGVVPAVKGRGGRGARGERTPPALPSGLRLVQREA